MQTKFMEYNLSEDTKNRFKELISKAILNLKREIGNDLTLEKLILDNTQLLKNHTKQRRKPEDVTKELIIVPILTFLGYSNLGSSSAPLNTKSQKEIDYTLQVKDERILVEVEPLNKNLFDSKNEGVEQLESYLDLKSFKADLGIATNGFDWVLIKFDSKRYKINHIKRINLEPIPKISFYR